MGGGGSVQGRKWQVELTSQLQQHGTPSLSVSRRKTMAMAMATGTRDPPFQQETNGLESPLGWLVQKRCAPRTHTAEDGGGWRRAFCNPSHTAVTSQSGRLLGDTHDGVVI